MTLELQEINRTLGNIEGKLDSLQDRFDGYTRVNDKAHEKINGDVDLIQAEVNKAKGASTVMGVVAGSLGAGLALVVKRFWSGE